MASVSILGKAVTPTLDGSIHRRTRRASDATHGLPQDPNTKVSGRITKRTASEDTSILTRACTSGTISMTSRMELGSIDGLTATFTKVSGRMASAAVSANSSSTSKTLSILVSSKRIS